MATQITKYLKASNFSAWVDGGEDYANMSSNDRDILSQFYPFTEIDLVRHKITNITITGQYKRNTTITWPMGNTMRGATIYSGNSITNCGNSITSQWDSPNTISGSYEWFYPFASSDASFIDSVKNQVVTDGLVVSINLHADNKGSTSGYRIYGKEIKLAVTYEDKPLYLVEAMYYPEEGSTTGSARYWEGETATFTAIPNVGYKFVKWSDGNTDNPRSFVVTGDVAYAAVFEKITYIITATAGTGGTVSGGGTYEHGSNITLKAVPSAGYKFVKWSDGVTTATRTVTVTGDATYTAVFEKTYYTLNYMSHEDGLYASVQEQAGVEMTLTYDLSSKIVSTYFRANYQGGEIQEVISYLVNNGWEDWNTIVASNGETFTGEQFDAPYYANKHPDLLNAFGYNKQSLVNHWANYGRNENRKAVDANARSTYPIGATVNLAAKEGDVIELYTQFGEAIEPVVFPSITRDGFKFLGWYDKPTGGNKIGDAGYIYMPTDLKNFYAHWEADPPKFADAQMLYNGKIVSSNNKVPAGQSFILKCKLE